MKPIKKLKKFMKELMPKNIKNIKKYRGKIPLFHYANIEKELNQYLRTYCKIKIWRILSDQSNRSFGVDRYKFWPIY